MSTTKAFGAWNMATAQKQPPPSPYSPLVQTIEHCFNLHQKPESRYLLIFVNTMDEINARPVPKGTWAWHIFDKVHTQSPGKYNLVLALDLEKSFDEQFPDYFKSSMKTWDSLRARPTITIPDRCGKIPLNAREKLLKFSSPRIVNW